MLAFRSATSSAGRSSWSRASPLAVAAGIAKVNVGTGLNIAMTRAVRAVLDEDPALVDPRRYLSPARAAMADTVGALLDQLGR